MIYKISHTFKPEIFLPWAGIMHNIDFMRTQDGQPVQLSDGSQAEVVSINEIHILSPEADMLSHRLYGISAITLLTEWYKRLPIISTMFFVNIKLKKYEAPTISESTTDASPLPEQDN